MTTNIISQSVPLVDKIVENGLALIFDTSFLIWSACFLVLIAYGITKLLGNKMKNALFLKPFRILHLSGQILVYFTSIVVIGLVAIGFPLGASYADHLPTILDLIESDLVVNSGLVIVGILLGLMVS